MSLRRSVYNLNLTGSDSFTFINLVWKRKMDCHDKVSNVLFRMMMNSDAFKRLHPAEYKKVNDKNFTLLRRRTMKMKGKPDSMLPTGHWDLPTKADPNLPAGDPTPEQVNDETDEFNDQSTKEDNTTNS